MPTRKRQPAKTFQADVVHRVALSETESLLKLQLAERLSTPFAPGAFAMISMDHEADVFQLGRAYTPFSFQSDGSFWLYIKAVGRVSTVVAHAPVGSSLKLIGPLGLSWPTLEKKGAWHVLADAANLAPVLAMATHENAPPIDSLRVIGAVADHGDHGGKWPLSLKPDLPLEEICEEICGEICETTLDNDTFWDGYFKTSVDAEIAFCLGLPWLEKALAAAKAREQLHRVWVYLKPTMACGTGSCYGCVTEVCNALPVRVCWEGPVLPASQLVLGGMTHGA
jgi:hypothetical protein